MKKILSVFLAITILSQVLLNVGLSVYYNLNKTYIAQKLCDNKSTPSLHCNGHCYLTKQLKKSEEGERNSSSKVLKEKEEIFSNSISSLPGNYIPAYVAIALSHYITPHHLPNHKGSLLKPPTV